LDISYELLGKNILLLVLQKVDARTIECSKTAIKTFKSSKSIWHFLMNVNVNVNSSHRAAVRIAFWSVADLLSF